jgi:hypothetical protein
MDNQQNQKTVRRTTHQWNILTFALPILFLLILFIVKPAHADPSGAVVVNNLTESALITPPDNRSDAGGTITTLSLSATQQNANWKAYVGNISGMLTLDDASGFSIYQWALGSFELTGELYVSRSNNVSWSTMNCSNISLISAEQTLLGFGALSVDDINKTFNYTTHPDIRVAGRTIANNTCRSTATRVNDAEQAIATADFPEVLLSSGSDLVYVSPLNDNSDSYATGLLADFQMIVPDDVTVAVTTYYFYIELGS